MSHQLKRVTVSNALLVTLFSLSFCRSFDGFRKLHFNSYKTIPPFSFLINTLFLKQFQLLFPIFNFNLSKMWRNSCNLLKRTVTLVARTNTVNNGVRPFLGVDYKFGCYCGPTRMVGGYYFSSGSNGGGENKNGDSITHEEAKRLMRLVNVEELKWKLGMKNTEVIGYMDLLKACKNMGVAKTHDEAVGFARVLDEAGVILLFRDKVYLHPDKVIICFFLF